MSTQKVKLVSKITLPYTATWATNVLTVTTNANHNLATGNLVNIFFQNSPQELLNAAVTVTGANTFTVAVTNPEWGMSGGKYQGNVVIPYYNTGLTGGQPYATIARGQGSGSAILQTYVTGTGGATYTVELSLDGQHWILAVATVTHSATSGDTAFVLIDPAWAYIRINPSVIGAATTLTALLSV